MPPKVMSTEMIEQEKNKILVCSLELIHSKGFENVSMRNIARRLGYSPTKIYTYFHSKDEILIEIAIKSFNIINSLVRENICKGTSPDEMLKNFVESYFYFSIEYKSNYEVIFGDRAVDYTSYYGTKIEETAKKQNQAAMEFIGTVIGVVTEFIHDKGIETDIDKKTIVINLMCLLHGTASFYNNKLIFGVCEDVVQFKQDTIDRIVYRFTETIL